ncbi:MAG: hypothetical protein NVSMB44_02750 [Ktedonobacteraceae bacterium]
MTDSVNRSTPITTKESKNLERNLLKTWRNLEELALMILDKRDPFLTYM